MAGSTSYTVNIKALFDASDALNKIKGILTILNNLKIPENFRNSLNSAFSGVNKSLEEFLSKAAKGISNKTDASNLNKSFDKVIADMEKYDSIVQKIRAQFGDLIDLSNWIKIDDSVKEKLENIKKEISDLLQLLNNITPDSLKLIEQVMNKLKTEKSKGKITDALDIFKGATDVKDILRAIDLIEKAKRSYSGLAAGEGQGSLTAKEIIGQYQAIIDIMKLAEQEALNILQKIDFKQGEGLLISALAAQELDNQLGNCANTMSQLTQKTENVEKPLKDLTVSAGQFGSELDQVKSRIQYFLGLANAINLVKRAIRSSFSTIKELDKAMTETAVVTNYTIKDMWKLLPDYTKRANLLGVTTKEAYESATLYYQLGLNTELAAALSTETLKMARIAGLDAADATDRMTNALRGFNMELNATLALRVDDVYSQLAAMSASNVDEISTAMTKVASLANNANMEFETTAAFLAQIIESTRESAETAGTALKTVVARFSEVKKLYDKEELKGLDEEGQVIDVNKVSAALRTAGIDLNKYFLGEVGLDDIFIELASKWDSLTNIQLRYIATQAAGSRQQSRFIALMADYARTQELVGAAYSSNGAAEKQFEKTLDSMQSKLARLKNAWDEFAMGLANNAVLKGAVDALTKLLLIVNKLTGALGSGAGSFLKWAVAIKTFGALKRGFGNGGFIDKAVTTILKGSRIGQSIIKGGLTSGVDLKGDVVAGSTEALARAEGKTTIIPRTSLLSDIFNGNLKKKILAFKEANANVITLTINQGIDDTTGGRLTDTIDIPQKTSLFGALGNSFVKNTKIGNKLAQTGLVKALVGGGMAEGAATLATALGGVAAAVAAIYAGYKIWQNYSLEGQLLLANKLAKSMETVADNTLKANTEVKKVLSEYGEKNTAVESALTLEERLVAVRERTDYVALLVKSNEKYADYLISTFENGELVLKLDESSINALATATAEAEKKASSASDFAAAAAAGKEAAVYEAKLTGVDLTKGTREVTYYDNTGSWQDIINLTPEEKLRYLAYLEQANSARLRERTYAKAAYANLIDTTGLTDAAADAVVSALAAGFSSDKFLSLAKKLLRADWWSGNATPELLRANYKALYGVDAGDLGKDALVDAVATAEVIQESYQNIADSITEITSSEGGLKLLEVIAGTYAGSLENIGAEISDAFNALDKTTAANLLKSLNLSSSNDLEKFLTSAIELIQKDRRELLKNAVKSLMKTGIRDTRILQNFAKLEAELLKKVLEVGDKLSDYGQQFRLSVMETMIDQIDNENILNFIDTFSDNIILTYLSILKEINSTNEDVSNFANTLNDIGKEGLFSRENLVLFYLASGEFDNLTELVDKFIEENGKITADNINELAKSSLSLNALLETGTMTATGMARAIQAFSAGNITISNLNDRVLEVFNSFENLNDIISKASYFIKNFDAGEDWGESFDFIESAIETIEGFIGSREFGNPLLQNYWGAIFKTSPSDLEGWEKGIEILKLLQEWGGGRFWTNVMGLSMDEKTGIIADMNVGNMTSSDYRNLMRQRADAFTRAQGIADFTDDYLNMQFQNMANHDYGVVELLAANDVLAIVKAYEGAAPTLADILAIADGFGLTPLAILDAYNKNYGLNYSFDLLKENAKKTGEELQRAIKESFEAVEEKYGTDGGELFKILGANLSGEFDIGTLKANITEIVPEIKNGEISVEDWINLYIGLYEEGMVIPVEFLTLKQKEDGSLEFLSSEPIELNISNLNELENGFNLLKEGFEDLNAATLVGDIDGAKTEAENLLSILQNLKIPTMDFSSITNAVSQAQTLNEALNRKINKTITLNWVFNSSNNNNNSNNNNKAPSNQSSNLDYFDWVNSGFGGNAAGGYVSYASGTRKVKPGVALTGEEGPELVWNKEGGYAYLTGKNGPEFRKLVAGDRIFPSDLTKAILARSVTPSLAKGGKVVPSYAGTAWVDANDKNKKNGSGSGNKKKDDEFKMDLDKYYNMVEDINELLRLRNLLETNYNQLLKNEGKTGKEIYDNLTKQLDLLELRYKITEDLAEKRKQQIIDLVAENEELSKYAWWNNEDLTIEIDWDLVLGITDKEEGGKVKDYLSKLEDLLSKYDELIEALEDIEDTVQDIKERGKDEYKSLEDRTRDALIKLIQDKIDELEEVDKAINDTNQKLFDSMLETLSMQRLLRDNAKTEEDLSDKEKRLAYLLQDSSNANLLEIAKLQEELADARQNYTDTLIDQKISELQRQNDEAQELRQQLIELMQRSLDWDEKSGAFWDEVYRLISEGIDATGSLIDASDLKNILKAGENWDSLSLEQKQTWAGELINLVTKGITYLSQSRLLEDIGAKEGSLISFTNAKGERLTGTIDKDGNVVVKNSDGSTVTYKDVFLDYYGNYRTFEGSGETKTAPKPATSTAKPATPAGSGSGSGGATKSETPETFDGPWYPVDSTKCYTIGSKGTRKELEHNFIKIPNNSEYKKCSRCGYMRGKLQNNEKATYTPTLASAIGAAGTNIRKNYKYATGGLNTLSGLAWLDGTASHPELVLNARDTQNFIELKDVLTNLRSNGGFNFSGGDNYYDIKVQVDSLGSDYDVDRAIDRIKARLAQDGAYRNVNTLSRLR